MTEYVRSTYQIMYAADYTRLCMIMYAVPLFPSLYDFCFPEINGLVPKNSWEDATYQNVCAALTRKCAQHIPEHVRSIYQNMYAAHTRICAQQITIHAQDMTEYMCAVHSRLCTQYILKSEQSTYQNMCAAYTRICA